MTEPTAEQKILSLTIEEYEQIQPIVTVPYSGGEAIFYTPNRKAVWRARTLDSKEPETVAWMNSFEPGEVLVDVGANVGMYSIWSALTRSVRVFAFEPESQNYALLNRNIFLNKLSNSVFAYCVALSDEIKFDKLHLSAVEMAGSCHSFGEEVDFNLRPVRFQHAQGCFSTTLDRLVADRVLPPPHHLKIDVDGLEHKVLSGAEITLQGGTLKSVLVEINTNLPQHMAIVGRLEQWGFHYSREDVEKCMVREGPFAGVANYVFRRRGVSQVAVPAEIRPLRA
ncbi:MAG: FkbM family methyltransferase [Planctomycetaceae bacterium]